ncbi:MAG: response regulator [Spirochaetales bacterium]|nr:response regulator [Spirochaetales bacterium]
MNKLSQTFDTRKQELHCQLTIPLIRYLEELYGTKRMIEIVEPLGLSVPYLKNNSNWMSFAYYNELLEKVVQVTGDELAPYKATFKINPKTYFDFVLFIIYNKMWSGSPRRLYKIIFSKNIYKRYTKIGAFKILSSTRDSITVEAKLFKGYRQTQYNCDAIKGILANAPLSMGLSIADVTEKHCAAKGASSCIYTIKWKIKKNWFTRISLLFIAAVIILQLTVFKGVFNIKDVFLTIVVYLLAFFMQLAFNLRRKFILQDKSSQNRERYLTRTVAKLEKDNEKILKLERQYHQSQKMEALGRIAGGIAHDFNNILTIINGSVECTKHLIKKNNPAYEHINECTKAVKRASELTKQLLTFAKSDTNQPIILNINELLIEFSKMITSAIGENIKLSITPSSNSANINVDKNQLERVLLNLILNAKEAMPDGGKLLITTENLVTNENYKFSELPPGEYVLISLRDTGKGIKKTELHNIFDPFYTTKTTAKSTGLGLAICYSMVKQNKGYIFVESIYDKGTTFYVYFPMVSGSAIKASSDHIDKGNLQGKECILFVEDESVLRKTFSNILTSSGYTIIQANNGPEALKYIQNNPDTVIDLLLTDIIMPKMNGYDLAGQIKQKLPDIKVVFISGYNDNIMQSDKIDNLTSAFLSKPFKSEDLLSTIHNILTRTP